MKDKPPNRFRDTLNTNLAELLALLQSVRSPQDEKRGEIVDIFVDHYLPMIEAESHYLLCDDAALLNGAIGIARFVKNCARAWKDHELISLADTVEITATRLFQENAEWRRVAYDRHLAGLEWLNRDEMADALKFYNLHGGFSTPRAYQINRLLAHLGYQVGEGNNWTPTKKAQGLYERRSPTAPLTWHRDLQPILRCAIEGGDVPASCKSLAHLKIAGT